MGQIEKNICNENKSNTLGFLKSLTSLEVLDLSNNKLMSSKRLGLLDSLIRLKELDLSSNGFHNFSVNVQNFFKKLNLAYNNIQCLSRSTMIQFTKLKNFTSGIKIDLLGNLLSCNCKCYKFFKWTARNSRLLVNRHSYQCIFDNGEKIGLDKLPQIILKLEAMCFSAQWFQVYIGLELATYFCISLLCLIYRTRHTIWYLYWRIKLNRQKLQALLDGNHYTYSAFISCDHRDCKYFIIRRLLPVLETEETRLKFCIAQRNFLVGGTILDNIMRSMRRSRKVICVISPYFLQSKWCKEELLIAHQVQFHLPSFESFLLKIKYVIYLVKCAS